MPRPNYGNAVKQRAVQFFTVLLDYANDELDLDDRQLDLLQRDIQFNWQTERRCALRTKVRHLEDLCHVTGTKLTSEQIKEAIKCLTDFLGIIEDNRTSKGGSETWHFTLNLWYDRFDRAANINKFEMAWDEKKSGRSRVELAAAEPAPDVWTEIIRSSLVAQNYQRLTTNPLMDGDRLKFSLDDVYIPLGLMSGAAIDIVEERDYSGDAAEMSATITPNLDRLLERLVANSEPNRIAIIGEPGAGKTTCLQKLAAGLLDTNCLPVWISLADLQGESLEHYLLHDWLKMATRQAIVDTKLQQDFAAQFARGKVWLLLDAVDEMAIDPSIALASLERQFRGWLGGAHILLTCRSNVWHSGKNALENFTTYRNLGLNYRDERAGSNRTHDFIYGWFKHAPEIGESLTSELSQPQYQRLRDAIKNPLRLALLCGYRSRTQGKLPSTKAILYQQFTDTIYEWKQDRFPTTLAQRQQLDRALSKLALAAITGDDLHQRNRWRFRLHHHAILATIEPELLELALQLGWLDRVGIDPRTGEKIYAFYHSTFQEYFAARSIDDWQYFFERDNLDRLPIFNAHWQETILFWFGRIDVPASEKEACIEALINFDRQCGGCYYYRAYFLAAAALAEFPESRHASTLVDRLLTWRFASYNATENTWKFYPLPIQDGARLALRQTDLSAAIAGLERFIQTSQNPFLCWQAAHSLGKVFDPGNAIAIEALVEAIPRVTGGDLKIKICESLIKIAPHFSQLAVDTLVEMVDAVKWTAIVRKAAFMLGKLASDPSLKLDNRDRLIQISIDTLEAIIDNSNSHDLQMAAVENLRSIDPDRPIIKSQFTVKQTPPTSTRHRRKKVPDRREIDVAIAEIERKLATTDKPESQRRYAYQLGKFQPGHLLAVETLLNLMVASQPSSFYKRTGEYLQEIMTDDRLPLIIDRLKSCVEAIDRGEHSSAVLEQYKLLWYCAERLPYRQFSQIWHDRQ